MFTVLSTDEVMQGYCNVTYSASSTGNTPIKFFVRALDDFIDLEQSFFEVHLHLHSNSTNWIVADGNAMPFGNGAELQSRGKGGLAVPSKLGELFERGDHLTAGGADCDICNTAGCCTNSAATTLKTATAKFHRNQTKSLIVHPHLEAFQRSSWNCFATTSCLGRVEVAPDSNVK